MKSLMPRRLPPIEGEGHDTDFRSLPSTWSGLEKLKMDVNFLRPDSGGQSPGPKGTFRSLFTARDTLKRVTVNSLWLAVDNVFRLGVAFLVSAWVARHLGPDRFGVLSYAMAFCAPFSVLVSLGLNTIVVRNLVREPSAAGEILGTVAGLKFTGALVALMTCSVAASLAASVDERAFALVILTVAGMTFQSADVFDLWFQSQGRARISAWVRSSAALAMNVGRVAMILCDAPLPWFAASAGIELALCAIGWGLAFRQRSHAGPWRFHWRRAASLLETCWPVAVAGLAIQIQAYFDQVLLAILRDFSQVGYYAAALRLVAVFGFIPMALQAAAAPEITRAHIADREIYLRRLRNLYRLVMVAFVFVALPFVLIPDQVVQIVFGSGYELTALLLPLLAIRILLFNLGVVRSLHIANEGIFRFAMVTALVGAVFNLGLNVLLIPRWGALGCVVSALLSFSINTLALECLHPKARVNLGLMLAAVGLRRLPV
ncbi:MAG: flippase [Opitutaceae bacterium]